MARVTPWEMTVRSRAETVDDGEPQTNNLMMGRFCRDMRVPNTILAIIKVTICAVEMPTQCASA